MAKASSTNVKMPKHSNSSSKKTTSSSSQRLPVDRPWQPEQGHGHGYQSSARGTDASEPLNRWLDEPSGLGPYNNIAEVSEISGSYTMSPGECQSTGAAATCKTKHGHSKGHKKHHGH
ncbi:hypothetical protein ACHAQA_002300 [Verticillium albo-atrum]